MIFYLVLLYICNINAISNDSVCDLFQTNGSYNGLKLYSNYSIGDNKVWLRNDSMYSNGKEWEFDITEEKLHLISINTSSVRDIDRNILFKMSTIRTFENHNDYHFEIRYKVLSIKLILL